MFFSGFETMPGWRDALILSLSFILIVIVVRLAESVVAPNDRRNVLESVIENAA